MPFPPPGDLPTPVIEPGSPALQADSLPATKQKVYFISKHFSNPPDYSMSETQPHFVDVLLSEDQLRFCSCQPHRHIYFLETEIVLRHSCWEQTSPC